MRGANFSPLLAALTAGPFFLLCLGAETLYAEVPHPIPVSAQGLLQVALILPLGAIFGFLFAILPSALATGILVATGDRWERARDPIVWVGIGTALGIALGYALHGPSDDLVTHVLPWAITSGWTAWICRRGITWE